MEKQKIKLVIIDVDNTLTNGMYFVSNNGDCFKQFYTKDFAALEKLQKNDIMVVIMTSSDDDCIVQKYKQLPASCTSKMTVFTGVADKKEKLIHLLDKWGIDEEEVAYMGDSDNDFDVMYYISERYGFTACPYDADDGIKEVAEYISSKNGGYGAVKDFCEVILECNNKVSQNG